VWAELQPLLDRLFLPFEQWIADAVAYDDAHAVLDVGCGAGATSRAIARRLGPDGHCTGIDISSILIEIAQQRATEAGLNNARFLIGDAQRSDFSEQLYDTVVSRFGVMFFDDPVAAFANISGALRPGGTLTCAAWRSAAENQFMSTAERAIAPILGPDKPLDPHAPGQFAFADAKRIETILAASGWDTIDIQPLDMCCTLSSTDLAIYARRMGRPGTLLPKLEESLRRDAEARLDDAFAAFVTNGVARFNAACWSIRARKPTSI
jgi:SAM-dependent methyltransferase